MIDTIIISGCICVALL